MSARWARSARGIEQLLRAFDVTGKIWILYGSHHDQIVLPIQERPELDPHAEVGIDSRIRFHRSELDEQVQIALPNLKSSRSAEPNASRRATP